MKWIYIILVIIVLFFISSKSVFSHCEIPCGIYNDELRIHMIEEHITTIKKSMVLILRLSKDKKMNYNQIVRWINNKEVHSNYIQQIVYQYFMAQRIKPVSKEKSSLYYKYINQITILHKIIVNAMKAKQTNDLTVVEELKSLLKDFASQYFGDKKKR